jgi:hypothetical protein
MISHLKQGFRFFQPEADLSLLDTAARSLPAKRPGFQRLKALPLFGDFLPTALPYLPSAEIRALVFLAYKSASRTDDMLELTCGDVRWIEYTNPRGQRKKGLFLQFGITKANRDGEARPDHLVVVAHSWREVPEFVDWMDQRLRRSRRRPLFTVKYKQVLRALRLIPIPPEIRTRAEESGRRFRLRFTGHSMKVGAADRLWELAAHAKIHPSVIPQLLKHKNSLEKDVPIVSVGYAPRLNLVALALQTHRITELL